MEESAEELKELEQEMVELEDEMKEVEVVKKKRKELKQLLTSWVTLLGGQSSASHFL